MLKWFVLFMVICFSTGVIHGMVGRRNLFSFGHSNIWESCMVIKQSSVLSSKVKEDRNRYYLCWLKEDVL